jgi:hypothetical protein
VKIEIVRKYSLELTEILNIFLQNLSPRRRQPRTGEDRGGQPNQGHMQTSALMNGPLFDRGLIRGPVRDVFSSLDDLDRRGGQSV